MYATKIYGHRGASEYAPENTMEAFKLAYEMGADGIELDVQLTLDGQLVVIHDENVDRVSNGSGLVKDMTLGELKSLCFNRTHPEYREARIPLLEEVLDCFSHKQFLINIELKNSVFPNNGLEAMTLMMVKKYGMLEKVIFSSFNHASMRKVAALEPTAQTEFLTSEIQTDVRRYLQENQTNIYHPAAYLLDRSDLLKGMPQEMDVITDLQESGIRINTWTVNSGKHMRSLCNRGIDGIITNKPDLGSEIRDDD